MATEKRPAGRPPKHPMPGPIDTDLDTLAEVVLKAPPKKSWRYEKKYGVTPKREN